MRRRGYLTTAVLGLSSLAGCSSIHDELSSYPDVPEGATKLSFEVHRRVDGEVLLNQEETTGLTLITDAEGLESLRSDWMTAEDEAFLDETDFSTSLILGIQIITSGDSTGINLVEVVRTNEKTVHSYSYVENPSGQDDAYPRGFIVRVERDGTMQPTMARHTHRGGNTDFDLTATPATQRDGYDERLRFCTTW